MSLRRARHFAFHLAIVKQQLHMRDYIYTYTVMAERVFEQLANVTRTGREGGVVYAGQSI
jgi:hypothetical protein